MKKFLQCVLVLVSSRVLAEPQIDLDLLIAAGANDVRRIKMQTPAVTQVSYNVNIQYPGVAISVDKVRLLEKQGWRQCDGDKASWEHFGDYAIEPQRLVHQYRLSFARSGEFMAIALQYLSALPSVDPTESIPDNTAQRVNIIHYDLSVEDVRRQMGGLADSCLRRGLKPERKR
jgi:hypothetical protein